MSKKVKAVSKKPGRKSVPGVLADHLQKYKWKKGGPSPNPGGGPKKFTTLLTDAIRDELGELSEADNRTYAAVFGREIVRAAVKEIKEKGLTNQALIFYREVRDGTEGKPIQKVILNGTGTTDPVERVKELLAAALNRAAGESSSD